MGLFSSSKKTYVSSVVYNLAGPIEDRPDYLKSVLLGNVLSRKPQRIVEVLKGSYLGGTGMRLRNYHRWARENFKQVGIPKDTFYGYPVFDGAAVADALYADFYMIAEVDWVDSGPAQIEMWGRQWLRDNMPAKETTDTWTVDYVEATGDALINFSDGTAPVLFKPTNYKPSGDWLYISYSRSKQVNRWTDPGLFIYERGMGSPALDAMFSRATSTGEYLPFIPIRHETKFLSSSYKPAVYDEAVKAYKKATGAKLSELIEDISENPDLDEIDFAYIMFGVSLNIEDMASRRYMFSYFKHLVMNQMVGANVFNQWAANQPVVTAGIDAWLAWYALQETRPVGQALTGPAPERPTLSSMPGNSVIIQDNGPAATGLKMEMTWQSMSHVILAGVGKPEAKLGDVWFTFANSQEIVASAYSDDEAENLTVDTIEAYWQRTPGFYEKMVIRGLTHINHIYNGKSVEITAAQALVDIDESGFIVPIHYETFRQMSLVDSTQMATQCMNIVFNCYQIVKKKWYQRGFFKVLLAIAVIAISIFFPPGGAAVGSTVGLLGTAATVGASLGFAGLAAIIAGTVANMVAAMILTQLITFLSVELLGDKIGFIVAAIASFVALNVGMALRSGETLASAWASMTSSVNILSLTNSVGNAYSQVINSNTMDILQKSQAALDDYRKQSLELQENYAEQFGYGTAVFNPMALTEVGESFFTEDADTFLGRTLMTGSDIAQMGNDLITNFVELTLHNEFKE